MTMPERARRRRIGADALEDVRYACRYLQARRASTLGAVAMLALGTGLASAMFALSDPFLSRPLPYTRAERLVLIDLDLPLDRREKTYPLLSDWQERTDLFDGLAGFVRHGSLRVRLPGRVAAIEAVAATPNIFEVLGVATDERPATAVSGDEVWMTSRGAGGPLAGVELAGRTLPLQPSGSVQIRGQLPSSFLMPDPNPRAPVDALVELDPGPIVRRADGGGTRPLRLVGRMADRMEPALVDAVLNAEAVPAGFRVTVTPLAAAMKAPLRPLATGALLAGVLVLLVCATNALGMALTRGFYRVGQMATMEVLGATRVRISRLLLAEALMVAGAGVAGGLVLVAVLLDVISAVVPGNFLVLGAPRLSVRVAAFAGLAGLLACAAWWAGSLTARRHGTRLGFNAATTRDRKDVQALRFVLTAGQVALTLVLLAGAGLLTQSYLHLVREDTGLSGRTQAVSVSYSPELTGTGLRDTIEQTIAELKGVPGVGTAAASVGQMVDQFNLVGLIVIEGRPAPVEQLQVTPGYFDAAGMSFAAGRPLMATDAGRRGVVINEGLVARHLGGRAEIGDLIQVGSNVVPIVGIVRDARRRALDEPPAPAAFLALDEPASGMRVTYLIEGSSVAAGAWESIVRRVSPEAVLLEGGSIRERLARSVQDRSFATLIVVLFAAATVSVTTTGLIGVVGYVVARRTREAGIRMALGAQPGGLTWLMMRDAVVATIAGAAAGLVGAVWLSGSVSGLLYGVSPTDWPTLTVTTAGLIALCVAAVIAPARRAGRLSPTVALREE